MRVILAVQQVGVGHEGRSESMRLLHCAGAPPVDLTLNCRHRSLLQAGGDGLVLVIGSRMADLLNAN